jgi:hypothetical protein
MSTGANESRKSYLFFAAMIITGMVVLVGIVSSASQVAGTTSASSSSASEVVGTTSSSSAECTGDPNGSSSIDSPDCLQLRLSVNATTLYVGQNLAVSVELVNPLQEQNNVPGIHGWPDVYNASDLPSIWSFMGFPIWSWVGCDQFFPMEFAIVKGNYTLAGLEAFSPGGPTPVVPMCSEGSFVNRFVFQPDSDRADLTSPNGDVILNPTFQSNYTVSGYWNETEISKYGSIQEFTAGDFNHITFPNPPPTGQTAFTPGTYTVAVSDEWGQTSLLYFAVKD